jgi:starch phosphorylase
VREYTEQHYLPAATGYRTRAANKSAVGREVVDWQHSLDQKWAMLHFGEVRVATVGEQHVFDVQLYLGDVDSDRVRVELYADGVNDSGPVRQEMMRVRQLVGAANGHAYSARVAATRPAADFTARVIPYCAGVPIPLETSRILWQR